MSTAITLKTRDGKDVGTLDLPTEVFGVQPNVPVMHQVVTAQLAHRRSGTQSTKTRGEVSGGGKKPFRQKGTGGARQGSIVAPHYTGGGIAHGPKPRKYTQRVPKKMVRLALASALSDRKNEGRLVIVDSWGFSAPSTKDASKALAALGLTGKILVVVNGNDEYVLEAALKIARKFGGRGRHAVVSAYGSFHGRTLAALAATGQPAKHEPFQPMPDGFRHVAYNDITALEAMVDPSTAAVLLETVTGSRLTYCTGR